MRRSCSLLARETAWTVRRVVRRPLAVAVAALVAAVALAPSLIFQLVDQAALPPLPFDRSEELVSIWQHVPWRMATSYPKLRYLAEHSRSMEVATIHTMALTLGRDGPAVAVTTGAVTPSFFDVLETKPLLGRVFRDDENDRLLDEPVIVLSEQLWRREFGASRDVLGREIALNNTMFSVIGVLPRTFGSLAFRGTQLLADAWVPAMMAPLGLQGEWRGTPLALELPSATMWVGIGRLRPGHGLSEARAEASALSPQVRTLWPWPEVDAASGSEPFVITRLSEDAVDPKILHAVSLLRVAGGLVLILGGLNLASLFLARGLERSKTLALHAILGAPRLALVWGALVEAVIVGALGGLGAIAVTRSALTLLGIAEPSILTAPFGMTFDPTGWRLEWPAVVTATVVSVVVAVGFSLAPALTTTRTDAAAFLRGGTSIATGGLHRLGLTRLGGLLVVLEVTLALALTAPALLLVRSLFGIVRADLGFRPAGVAASPLRLPATSYPEEKAAVLAERAVRGLARIPGIEAASWTSCLPVDCGLLFTNAVNSAGAPERAFVASVHVVAPDAFRTLGIPIHGGRDFGADDRPGSPPVVILGEGATRALGASLGARVDVAGAGVHAAEVVGVVADVPYGDLAKETLPAIYFPLAQRPQVDGVLIVRSSSASPAQLAGSFRRVVESLDPRLERASVTPLESHLDRSVARFRGAAWLLAAAAVLALILSCLGVYGALSSLVAGSVPEIGIRMTLGASPRAIGRSIAGAALSVAAAGGAIGAALGMLGATYLRGYLYGVRPWDTATLLATVAVTAGLALAAAFSPARRATRVDPMVVLRSP